MAKELKEKKVKKLREKLIKTKVKNLKEFIENPKFKGPSLYFHIQAIKNIKSKNRKKYLEYIYATLVSWGMHRMGLGAKMVDFNSFVKSINKNWKLIKNLKKLELKDLSSHYKEDIRKLFKEIKIMKTKTKLVGNSKVMAHLLPNLIPPIDRQYTLQYIKGNKNIPKEDPKKEFKLFWDILTIFFQPIAKNNNFNTWAKRKINTNTWNTSIPKIIDNLIIMEKSKKTKN